MYYTFANSPTQSDKNKAVAVISDRLNKNGTSSSCVIPINNRVFVVSEYTNPENDETTEMVDLFTDYDDDINIDNNILEGPKIIGQTNVKWVSDKDILSGNKKWTTLDYSGPYLPDIENPPRYYPDLKLKKQATDPGENLTPLQQHVLMLYAKKKNERGNNYIQEQVFVKNFNTSLSSVMGREMDVTQLFLDEFVDKLSHNDIHFKEQEGGCSESEKFLKHGIVVLNGVVEYLTSFQVDEMDIICGSKNKYRGFVKLPVTASMVTVITGNGIPSSPMPLEQWKVSRDNSVEYVCTYTQPVAGLNKKIKKYINPLPNGQYQQINDYINFEKARVLEKNIEAIRESYQKDLDSVDNHTKQFATCLYLIDHYGFDVKSKSRSICIGVVNLKWDDLVIINPQNGKHSIIKLDAVNLDVIKLDKSFNVYQNSVVRNITMFAKNKSGNDKLFDKVTIKSIDNYIKTQTGLDIEAKHFKIRLGSKYCFDQLGELSDKENTYEYNMAILSNVVKCVAQKLSFVDDEKTECIITSQLEKELVNKTTVLDFDDIDILTDFTKIWDCTKETSKYIDPRIIASWTWEVNMNESFVMNFAWASYLAGEYFFSGAMGINKEKIWLWDKSSINSGILTKTLMGNVPQKQNDTDEEYVGPLTTPVRLPIAPEKLILPDIGLSSEFRDVYFLYIKQSSDIFDKYPDLLKLVQIHSHPFELVKQNSLKGYYIPVQNIDKFLKEFGKMGRFWERVQEYNLLLPDKEFNDCVMEQQDVSESILKEMKEEGIISQFAYSRYKEITLFS